MSDLPGSPQTPPEGGFNWGLGAPATGVPAPAAAPPAREPVTEATTVSFGQPDHSDPLGSLFQDTSFKNYEGESLAGSVAGKTTVPPLPAAPRRAKGEALPGSQRILVGAVGVLVAVLLLVGLFFAGTRLPALLGPAPAVAVSKTPAPTPKPSMKALPGPVAVGVHKWSELRGGECLSPFTTVWAETFTVVDCTTPHPAQLVFRGTFPATVAAPVAAPTAQSSSAIPAPAPSAEPGGYPGIAALQAQISLLCTAPGVINLTAAGAFTDIQFQAAYAADAKEWMTGQHDYFCFVTRSTSQPLTVSVATPAAG